MKCLIFNDKDRKFEMHGQQGYPCNGTNERIWLLAALFAWQAED